MDVSKQIMGYVSNAKRQVSSAESTYDSRASYIEIRSSSTIDLFGSDAVSRVAEIAKLTREASDDLYTTYQALVKLLDEQCRPLLDAGPYSPTCMKRPTGSSITGNTGKKLKEKKGS